MTSDGRFATSSMYVYLYIWLPWCNYLKWLLVSCWVSPIPFGHRPPHGSHFFTPFFSTSVLSDGQLLTQEVPSTRKFAEKNKSTFCQIISWTNKYTEKGANNCQTKKKRKKSRFEQRLCWTSEEKKIVNKKISEEFLRNKATCVGTHWDTGPRRLSHTGTWHWGWAPVWMCACCKWGFEDTEAHTSRSCWTSCKPATNGGWHIQQTDLPCVRFFVLGVSTH